MGLPPSKAIKAYCLDCAEFGIYTISQCDNQKCKLHAYRRGRKKLFEGDGPYRPIKAIRAHCLDCCLGDWKEVKGCPAKDCILHPFRFGHKPKPDLPFAVENARFSGGLGTLPASVDKFPAENEEGLNRLTGGPL